MIHCLIVGYLYAVLEEVERTSKIFGTQIPSRMIFHNISLMEYKLMAEDVLWLNCGWACIQQTLHQLSTSLHPNTTEQENGAYSLELDKSSKLMVVRSLVTTGDIETAEKIVRGCDNTFERVSMMTSIAKEQATMPLKHFNGYTSASPALDDALSIAMKYEQSEWLQSILEIGTTSIELCNDAVLQRVIACFQKGYPRSLLSLAAFACSHGQTVGGNDAFKTWCFNAALLMVNEAHKLLTQDQELHFSWKDSELVKAVGILLDLGHERYAKEVLGDVSLMKESWSVQQAEMLDPFAADTYTELGDVFLRLHEEERAKQSFFLAICVLNNAATTERLTHILMGHNRFIAAAHVNSMCQLRSTRRKMWHSIARAHTRCLNDSFLSVVNEWADPLQSDMLEYLHVLSGLCWEVLNGNLPAEEEYMEREWYHAPEKPEKFAILTVPKRYRPERVPSMPRQLLNAEMLLKLFDL